MQLDVMGALRRYLRRRSILSETPGAPCGPSPDFFCLNRCLAARPSAIPAVYP